MDGQTDSDYSLLGTPPSQPQKLMSITNIGTFGIFPDFSDDEKIQIFSMLIFHCFD